MLFFGDKKSGTIIAILIFLSMECTDALWELRQRVPIGIGEALSLLEELGEDISLCEAEYLERTREFICRITGGPEAMVARHYMNQKYDVNNTIQAVRNEMYGQSRA